MTPLLGPRDANGLQGWDLAIEAEAWRELVHLEAEHLGRKKVAGLVAEDLRRAGGLRLDGLDVVVTGLEPARGGR